MNVRSYVMDEDMNGFTYPVNGCRTRHSTGGIKPKTEWTQCTGTKGPTLNSKHYKLLSKKTLASIQALKPEIGNVSSVSQSTVPSSTRSSFSFDVSHGEKRLGDGSRCVSSMEGIKEENEEKKLIESRTQPPMVSLVGDKLASLSSDTIDMASGDAGDYGLKPEHSCENDCRPVKCLDLLRKESLRCLSRINSNNGDFLSPQSETSVLIDRTSGGNHLLRTDSSSTIEYNSADAQDDSDCDRTDGDQVQQSAADLKLEHAPGDLKDHIDNSPLDVDVWVGTIDTSETTLNRPNAVRRASRNNEYSSLDSPASDDSDRAHRGAGKQTHLVGHKCGCTIC